MSEAILQLNEIKNRVSSEEWAIRQDLAAAYRLIAHYGWDDMVFTHLSARVPGLDDHFLLNPYGYQFSEVTASNLVKVDLDGNLVLDNGFQVNAAGFTIHSAVHMARHDAMAVMHVHTDAGVAVSSMQEGLLPLSQHAMFIYHDLSYHDWEGVALDLDERERVVADLGEKHVMLLRNHGTLAVGGSIASCFLRLYYLERACKIQLGIMSGTPNIPSQQAIDMMQKTFNNKNSWEGLGGAAWPSMRRLADRLDTSYQH
ncbi:MAG: class II aldolase [Gammaproteobacteria bacterium]|nr:class II aldolase [Gammaproteobacteria bacterium]